ncbi:MULTISPECIES: YraN family protein [unclassified Cellulomonas]|uniref:YraN family protein n=1 Tax=unclassified Cellulomonas TaxID=2620175 RepID=UPI001C4E6424|nr:YraN family protein [Cellulomonas sp. PS-H5]MBW0255133.1 YraN family protein [Cellulomonas sp. PS-H5]
MRTRNETGRLGEDLAARLLENEGWTVLDRNWFGPGGELDLVALDPDEDAVVGVEVKTRRTATYGTPHEAVTPRKVQRLRVLLGAWLAEHDVHAGSIRLDLVAVELRDGRPPRAEHLAGIG